MHGIALFSRIVIAAASMCAGLVNAQTDYSLSFGEISAIVSSIVTVLPCWLTLVIVCVKSCIYCKRLRSEEQSVPQRVQLPSTMSSQQPCPEPSYSMSEAFTGVPHSTVPLESEFQNAPPPDYSTAH